MAPNFLDTRLPARFWEKCTPEPNTGCWLWIASNDGRYGRYALAGRGPRRAHIVAYSALVGAVPTGLELDHRCNTQLCCNPAHLEPVTHAVNVSRGRLGAVAGARQRSKTHCPRGHAYAGHNLIVTARRSRVCRACAYEGNNRAARKRRAA